MRILQATVANDRGGLTGYIINNYRRINKEKFQFDFITYDDELDFSAEISSLGARIFRLPRPSRWMSYYRALQRIQEENSYDCIHYHLSYANAATLLAAKLAGFPRIIVHSHSTGFDEKSCFVQGFKMMLHTLGKMLMPWLTTDFFACSQMAAEWMFPSSILKNEKHQLMYNAILLKKFQFDEEKRVQMRQHLGIRKDCLCIGHVGRFTYQKNHEKLLHVFAALHEKCPQSVLMLVGDGPNREMIENMARQLRLQDNILFLGNRDDVASLYQAMDIMVMPSRFEGLCIVAIEAQMADLPCLCSDRLSMETKVTESYISIPLEAASDVWVEEILRAVGKSRVDQTESLRTAGYDSYEAIKKLERVYSQIHTDVIEKSKPQETLIK